MSVLLKKSTETSTASSASSAAPSTATALEFRAPRKELAAALKRLASVADRKSTMPVLAYVSLRADLEGVVLRATDLNNSLTVRAPAWHVIDRGGILIPAKALSDVVGKLTGDEVSIKATATGRAQVTITCGGVCTSLQGLPDRDFPKLPDHSELSWSTIDGEAFADQLKRVLPSICQDDTRFHLCGVFLESNGLRIRCVTTDGHRLTRCDVEAKGPELYEGVIVNAKGAKLASKLLKGASGLAVKFPHAFVRVGGYTLACKLIDAKYPPYEQVIPKNHGRLVTVERKALLSACERAETVCTETRGVKLSFVGRSLVLTSDHPDLGTQTESLVAEGACLDNGDSFAIGFNPGYLVDALKEIDCKHVTFAFDHDNSKSGTYQRIPELSPALIRSTEHAVEHSVEAAPFLVVVMPMRI